MRRCRVAITGLANSGKTVFLTQLISHLEHFKPAHFDLGAGCTITEFRSEPIGDGVARFPYREARARLLGHDPGWPPATREVCGLALEFDRVQRPSGKRRRQRVELYDFPGELLIDLNLPDLSFATWSERVLRRLRSSVSPLGAVGEPYLRRLREGTPASAPELVKAYHETLERAVRSRATLVSPGAWIYQRGGSMLEAPIGFAPLEAGGPPALRAAFEAEFDAYRKWLDPFVEVFRKCERSAILIDVLEILRGGQSRYVERKEALQELAHFYVAAHGWLERTARDWLRRIGIPVDSSRVPLTHAIVVATKADAVLEDDRGLLAGLLEEMLQSEFARLGCRVLEFRACAAYDATRRVTDGTRWAIEGRTPSEPDQERPRAVARLPERWPDHPWTGSEFATFRQYLPPLPRAPVREDAVFPHINLDEITRQLLDFPASGRRA